MESFPLVVMLATALGFAQTSPPRRPAPAKKAQPAVKPAAKPERAAEKWPIESISVEGAKLYTPAQVIAVSGLKVGQMAGKPEFDAAYARLMATGAFEQISYRFSPSSGGRGFAAVFQIIEVEPAYPPVFEDLGVPEKEVRAALAARDPLFGDRIPATKAVLDRYTKWVQEIVNERNIDEKIASRVTATGPDQFAIVFRFAKNLPAVAQVSFQGNQVIESYLLREAIGGVAIGQPYTEEKFRALLDSSVRPLYERRGRVRVKFTEVRSEPVKDVAGLHVFVTVDEGQTYELGEVAIVGPTPIKPADLLKAAKIKTGDLANFDEVNRGLEQMRLMLRRAGFLLAKTTTERKIDDAKKTVSLAVRIEEGPRYTMGQLTVKGLDLHGEAEVRRLWSQKTGSPFNGDYPDYFLNQIRERGVFESLGKTWAEVKVEEKTRTADVILHFEASPAAPDSKRPRRQPGSNLPI